jgi:transcription antitermination factor NusG
MTKKSWVVIKYKLINETRLIDNLINQNFTYYFPKVLIKKNNQTKSLNLFPGYAFVQFEFNKMSALNYTKGLSYVLKSGVEYSVLDNSYIDEIKAVQDSSMKLPLPLKPKLNSDAIITEGPLKGRVIRIIAFKSKDRISFMYNLLGRDLLSDIEINNIKF